VKQYNRYYFTVSHPQDKWGGSYNPKVTVKNSILCAARIAYTDGKTKGLISWY